MQILNDIILQMPPIYAQVEGGNPTHIGDDGKPVVHASVEGSNITISVARHLPGADGSAEVTATYGMALHGDHQTLKAGEEKIFNVQGEKVVVSHKER